MKRIVKRIGRRVDRFFNRMRHPDALRAATQPGTAPDLEAMRGRHYCLLVTFKRSGEAIPSPVGFGLDDGKLYFRTESDVAKLKRIRNDPRVRVGPCDWRGKPLGPLAEGTALVLPPADRSRAHAILKRSWTFGSGLFERTLDLLPIEFAYVEVSLS